MENKQEINIDHLRLLNKEAAANGKDIASFDFYEVSLIPGGVMEIGPISNIKYNDGSTREDLLKDPAHVAFLGHELNHK